jgi:2,4-didehydro-3-deoxy-L-rhamnonate hydrolase
VKLARLGPPGAEMPAVVAHRATHDLRALAADLDAGLFAGGGIEAARGALERGELPELEIEGLGRPRHEMVAA